MSIKLLLSELICGKQLGAEWYSDKAASEFLLLVIN